MFTRKLFFCKKSHALASGDMQKMVTSRWFSDSKNLEMMQTSMHKWYAHTVHC